MPLGGAPRPGGRKRPGMLGLRKKGWWCRWKGRRGGWELDHPELFQGLKDRGSDLSDIFTLLPWPLYGMDCRQQTKSNKKG